MSQDVPRPEYPRPSYVRSRWLALNGSWQFEVDQGDSGLEAGMLLRELTGSILVPFAPECALSGVGRTDFLESVWYRRTLDLPVDWSGQQVQLHFGAVDYDTTVWLDGQEVGRHRGGFTSFSVNLGPRECISDDAVLVVRARDSHHGPQARGKQARDLEGTAALYGRTTGIWQSVWAEPVAASHLERARVTPDLVGCCFHLEVPVSGSVPGLRVRAVLRDQTGEVAREEVELAHNLSARLVLKIPRERARVWAPGDPHLYDLDLLLLGADGEQIDRVSSYAGLRSVGIHGPAVLLNGEPVFQRLVLDQGYYPTGLMTAPSDQALVEDITMSMAAGFNGARLHQKVFEERFLYHADRLGYLVWSEFGDWGCREGSRSSWDHQRPDASYVGQWLEALERDYSHPSIVGWCPLNETFQVMHDRTTALDDVTRAMFLATKAMDTSRPVLDASGYSHRVATTDVYDSHDYEQDPAVFATHMAPLAKGKPYSNGSDDPSGLGWSVAYAGQPYFCSEFGGIWWSPDARQGVASWGYGAAVDSEDEVYERFAGLVDVLLDDPLMFGYCYTQLTDVFQEQNGVYRFDRGRKLNVERLAAIQSRPAAIETTPSPA